LLNKSVSQTERRWVLSYLPIILLPLILFAGPVFWFEALYWGTPGLQFIPWRVFAWESLINGSIPLWNPYNGMGAPLVANYQTALFYPPGWILYLFAAAGGAPWLAWSHTLLVIMHLIWAGVGMARLLHRLDLGILSQIVGALAFAMGGYLVARSGFFSIVWTASWLPWVILAASQIAAPVRNCPKPEKPFLPIGLLAAVALMLLAGHAQLSWYILLLAFFWVLVGGFYKSGMVGAVRSVIRYGFAAAVGAILASIQLLPTAEYLLQSQRSSALDYETALSYSFWPWRFLTLLAPDFFGNPGHGTYWGYANYWEDAVYIGVLPVLLAFTTASFLWSRNRVQQAQFTALIGFAWIVTLIGFLLALGRNTPVFPFLYNHIPTFNLFNGPARWLIWPLFGLSLLAGVGVDRWRTPSGRGLYWLRLSTAGGFAVTLGAFLAWYFLWDVNSTFIRATALAGLWGLGTGFLTLFKPSQEQSTKRWLWGWIVILWVCFDLLVAGWVLNPTIEASFYRSTPGEFVDHLRGKRTYLSLDDDNYLKFRRFFRFEDFRPIEDPIHLRSVMLPNLNLLEGIHSVNNFDPIVPARYAHWMQHLVALEPKERYSWLAVMNVGLEEVLDMHEDVGVRFDPIAGGERARWYTCAVFVDDEEAAFHEVKQQLSKNDLERVVLEGGRRGNECYSGAAEADIAIRSEPSGKVVLIANVSTAGWIFLADTWYPGWEARVNGEKVEILRANYLFRAVEVPAGNHEIEFRYRPISFIVGATVSLGGWIIVLLSIIMMKVFTRRTD
jgi:hypothetical protein